MRTKFKRHDPLKGFVGLCPHCRMLLAEMDVLDWERPQRLQHLKCRRCGEEFRRKKCLPKFWRASRKRLRLPGFHRTHWKENQIRVLVECFKDIINMPFPKELVEKKLFAFAQKSMKELGCDYKQLDGILLLAAQQSLWSNTDFIKERFEALYMDKPLKMITGWAGKKVLRR